MQYGYRTKDMHGKYEILIRLPEAVVEHIVEIIATDDKGNIGIAQIKFQKEFYKNEYYNNAIEIEGSEFPANAS